jgi:hypothetical protein
MSISLLKNIGTSDTEIFALNLADVPRTGYITIESEIIRYAGVSDLSFLNCTRATRGTSAVAHLKGNAITPVSGPTFVESLGNNLIILRGTIAPIDGTSGTGAGVAGIGSIYINTAVAAFYQNSGSLSSPTWSMFQEGSDLGITQLTGAVTAGPGNGSQAASLASGSVTPAKISTTATDDFSFPRDVAVGGRLHMNSYTTTERNALTPAEADVIYNVTTHELNYYTGSGWQKLSHENG